MVNTSRRQTRQNGGKKTYSTDSFFNFTKDSYLERTSRPIYAVLFLLPFIFLYEIGTFYINTDVLNGQQLRVVAFVWIQQGLTSMGFNFSQKFAWMAPGLVVVVILLSQQLTSGKKWKVWLEDFLPMIVECILLAVPLIVFTLFLNSFGSPDNSSMSAESHLSPTYLSAAADNHLSNQPSLQNNDSEKDISIWADIVTGIGAGIYEELVFRLILICLLLMLFQDVFRLNHGNAIALAVLISAGLFSAYHHIDFLTGRENTIDPFDWSKFMFRTVAGVYFTFLYAIRGFGITAGTHSFYDIIAVFIRAGFFSR
jgi:membrane protease YdiL (CAAX protease family)